jgi:hypothetical protein
MIRRVLILLALSGAGPALADCAARLLVPMNRQIPTWLALELAHGGQLQETIDLRVSETAGCPPLALGVAVEIADGLSRAQVLTAPNGAEIGSAPGAGQPLLALADSAGGEGAIAPVVAWSAQGRALRAGPHGLRLRWRLYPADGLLPQPLSEVETQLTAMVPAVLEVALVAAGAQLPLAGAQALLDFGEVGSGALRSAQIQVRGNARAQLAISRRWGELRLRDRPGYAIPYTLLLDGQVVDGEGSHWLLDGDADTGMAQLEVQLGDVEKRAAGVYEDILTLVVSPE